MEALQSAFMEFNPHASLFHNNTRLLMNDPTYANFDLVIRADPSKEDIRRYNQPSVNTEVATLLPMDLASGNPNGSSRDVVLHARGGDNSLHTMHESHQFYDPWCFPLLHPFGDAGWTLEIPHQRSDKHVTVREFYAYRLHTRGNDSDFLFKGGRLFQEYVTDMWAKSEHNSLRFLMNNQDKLRSTVYQGAMDHLLDSDADPKQIGKRVILPSSFSSGPRAMLQQYYDSMAIAGHFGKPTYFVTVTMNPKRPEVVENIPSGQDDYNRPDLSARGFKVLLDDIMTDIVDGGIFGKVVASVYVIEFQKRGLPHSHILLWLDENDVPKTSADLDNVVCAEIPDPESQVSDSFLNISKHI